MAARNRTKLTSSDGYKDLARGVMTPAVSPIPLTEHEQKIFKSIVDHREPATWSENDLRVAANLAICYRRIEEVNEGLDAEGYTTRNDRGTLVTNPLGTMLLQITSTVVQLNKLIGLGAAARGLTNQDQQKRNSAARATRKVLERASEGDLI
jgi:hypothetical protein